jgi:trigger factor
VVAAEGIEADEEAIRHEIEHLAEDSGRSPDEVERSLRENGTYALLREELARQKALDFLVEHARAVPMPPEDEQMPGSGEEPGGGEGVVEARVESAAETEAERDEQGESR